MSASDRGVSDTGHSDGDIAIVGMAVRLPGAVSVRQYWANLERGVESVRAFSDAELREAGVPEEEIARPGYVKAGAPLEAFDGFDAEFFGFSPKEAAIMDPQHRQFLECAWEALEDAGHPPESFAGSIGVFGGCGMSAYFAFNLLSNPDLVDSVGLFLLRHTGNDKDFLTTRVSYSLNLRGPSVNVQTACSTSLVAAHLACQSLLSGECDLALAGGVTIEIPHRRGYRYQEGEILSPDGHCRAFDHRAEGTVFGSGAGVVVLRRLADALRDGDEIYAVIKGSAVNNDGSAKVGYLAPSVDGQAQAIVEALAVAGVDADSIGYVECHGTGTAMGDPIEIAALTQAFRRTTAREGYCGVGSVKTNIGHLDTAAGVASLVKTVLSLRHGKLPPSLHFESPNPSIDFAHSPFVVNSELREWPRGKGPRRAGVNSLGVGGTNAYAIVEEAPPRAALAPSRRPFHLIALSARTRPALDAAAARLAEHLGAHGEQDLADIAYTLQEGRRAFAYRRVVAAASREEAAALLGENDPRRVFSHAAEGAAPSVAFMFPGGGAQHPRMAWGLYEAEPVFREWMDRGLAWLRDKTDVDVRSLLAASEASIEEAARSLERPSLQLPAIFIVEIALARLWMSWGVTPAALIGHSLGEIAAACVAEVFRFEDALGLVLLRGQLMESLPEGGMLSVQAPLEALAPLLGASLDVAAVNAPGLTVVSGPVGALTELEQKLAVREIDAKRVRIHIAAHSRMLSPVLAAYGAYLKKLTLSAPKLPLVSNVTGTWLAREDAVDPAYWVRHLRSSVLFADGVKTLLAEPRRVLLEVGPGKTLGSLARQHPSAGPGHTMLASLRHAEEVIPDAAFFLTTAGRLWAAGARVDLEKARGGEKRRRVSLPTYPFQHQRYFIEPGRGAAREARTEDEWVKTPNLDDWFYRPTWTSAKLPAPAASEPQRWLLFMDELGLGERVREVLEGRGHDVVIVRPSDAYYPLSANEYRLSPEHGRDGYDALVRDLVTSGKMPDRVLHLWLAAAGENFRPGSSFFHRNQERGFYSLLFLAQALADQAPRKPMHVIVVSSGMQRVEGEAVPYPDQATVLGPCRVIPRELPGVTCASVDLPIPPLRRLGLFDRPSRSLHALADDIVGELFAAPGNRVVAFRGGRRFEQGYERARLATEHGRALAGVRDDGTYLVTGAFGGIGLTLARHLASKARVNLILGARAPLPDAARWDEWLARYGSSDPTSQRILAVRELESRGARVYVLAADIADPERMARGLEAARRRFGPLRGVIHAAGVMKDELLQTQTQAGVERVFAPKVYGTLVLDALVEKDPLDFFVLFSSTSTITAPAGQVDYVAANAFLNAYAESRRVRPYGRGRHRRTVSVNWGIWSDIGMGAEAARKLGADDQRRREPLPAPHPLLDEQGRRGDKHLFFARYSPSSHWVLGEHRTGDGRALLPGSAYLELARAALAALGERLPFEMEDLFFLRPLAVADDRPKEIRVKLTPSEHGYDFEVQSRRGLRENDATWELHAQGKVTLGAAGGAAKLDLAAIAARCSARTLRDPAGIASRQERHLRFGARWRVLREASYGEGEALGRLELAPQFAADLEGYLVHPALLDIATGFAMDLIADYGGETLWVPVSYGRARVRGPLGGRLASWVKIRPAAGREFASFDVIIADEAGNVLLEVEELTLRRLAETVDFALGKEPAAGELETEPSRDEPARPRSPAEIAFLRQLERGISAEEGCAAFDRVLERASEPRVVISSLELPLLIRSAEAAMAKAEPGAKFARPELASSYVAPRDEVERTLVGFWEELLGVDQVGVEDSFFDLGGHSLIAVRLFAKIKQTYQAEYPISVLFEAPTIARCAALLRGAAGKGAGEGAAEPRRADNTHLVPMHATARPRAAQKTPFFLVAGMFGNVLNLRHLALLLGQERPFYGLQARGLYGDHTPHETFEAMAADYLAELRTVQPTGPYLLGGFSGGGITAYEMARQLLASGEQVALLVLLDTPLPGSPPLTVQDRWMLHVQRFRQRGAAHFVDWVKDRYSWENGRRRKVDGPEVKRPFDFHSDAIAAAFVRALRRYDVKSLPIPVTLFRPRLDQHAVLGPGRVVNRERRFIYHDNGWGAHVNGVEVFEMPGDHDSMVLEPNVRVLAARLRDCIERAEDAAPASHPRISPAHAGEAPPFYDGSIVA